jgi:tetratricopeptide (TPR) repeat protein
MVAKRPTICLNMIVKDEARIIRRCLDSALPFFDSWVIVDTGSSDGTQEIVRQHLAAKPGELFERPWRGFGHSRSEALELARGRCEYTLLLDADEVMLPAPGFVLGALPADEVQVLRQPEGVAFSFMRTTFVRSRLPWRYVGVLHEVVDCPEPHTKTTLGGLTIRYHADGARNADPVAKYRHDAAVLEEALGAEPDNARYVFYLAQSYRDAGELDKSIEAYRRRVAMGGWAEEVWYSLLQLGVLHERLGHDRAQVVDAYLQAYQCRPSRAEPLCELARFHRGREQLALAHVFAAAACRIARPDDTLFIDEAVYAWRCLDELAISAYYVGQREEGLGAARRLLREGKLPAGERPRVEANQAFYLERAAAPTRTKPAPARVKRSRSKRRA